MTPTRQCVVLFSGSSVTISVKDELRDIEGHVEQTLLSAMGNPEPSVVVRIGDYWFRRDAIVGWYFRDYRPDVMSQMAE